MKAGFKLGANLLSDGRWSFHVWAPKVKTVTLQTWGEKEAEVPMVRDEEGCWSVVLDGVGPGTRYKFRLDEKSSLPDPASRSQPEGVHGASELVSPDFAWEDASWFGIPLREYILYEIHAGTFTPEGTFDAVIPHLEHLLHLGITAIEIMPVAQFPGSRNWGYDGVYLFAPQHSYGGPDGLKRLVNACHKTGLAVVLDVVYNHFGPEGNYVREFGPYFNEGLKTLWGGAINFDGPHCDGVRRFYLENALYWQKEFHFDALRLDAVHAIKDFSAVPFLQELARETGRQAERLNRRFYLIAESDLNDARLIRPEHLGGFGLHAQWSDDFHHCLHVLLTGEKAGYYEDFGGTRQLAKIMRHGYAFTGDYSKNRKRPHGNMPYLTSAKQFVVFSQNHDQVGNRLRGDRLSQLAPFESLKLAASAVLLSPFVPLLFMGEEYGESAPFQYMTSHSDPELVHAVREGRRQEFAAFHVEGPVPDPQAEGTFLQSKLDLALPHKEKHRRVLLEFYRELIRLRKEVPAIAQADKDNIDVQPFEKEQSLLVRYSTAADEVWFALCFANRPAGPVIEVPGCQWQKLLDSAAIEWHGPGSSLPAVLAGGTRIDLNPKSVVLYRRIQPSE